MAYGFVSISMSFIPAFAYIAAVIFAITRWHQYPKPSRLLLAAALLLLATSFMSIGFMFVVRFVSPANTAIIALAYSVTNTLLHLLSFGLLVAAVYSSRSESGNAQQPYDTANSNAEIDHRNPYAPPP